MKAGTILYANTDLGLWGPVSFTIAKTPDPAPPARATHRRVEISVRLTLDAAMPATAWARARAVETLLSTNPEGVLEILDENGRGLSWSAVPGDSTLPEAIQRGRGRVEMKFHATEPVADADTPLKLTIDPLDDEDPQVLQPVTSWNFKVSPSRPDSISAYRSEVGTLINFSARSSCADPTANLAGRINQLMAEQSRIESLAGKEALLEFGDFSRTVQIESLVAKPDDGWNYLTVEGQARRNMLPGDNEAEIQFTTNSSEDPTTGETRTTIAGTIRAADKSTADDKLEGILMAWRTAARRVTRIQKTDEWVDGEDEDAPQWLEKKFQIELTEGSTEARYSLRIDTREGDDGARTTYSGTVHSSSLAVLMATVETAAGGKHPVELRAELSLEYATDDQGTLKLSHATFSREYATANGRIRGSVEKSVTEGNFGEWSASVTGSIAASSIAIARSIARSLIPAGVLLRVDDEKVASAVFASAANGSNLQSQDSAHQFIYSWGTNHTTTAITYKDTTVPDYASMTQKRTIAGTCWATDKTTAAAQVALLLSSLGINNATEVSLTHSHERLGNSGSATDRWLEFEFSYGKISSITGTVGHDIIEAEWEIERTGQVNHKPITEMPLSMPVQQVEFGFNIGKLVASGRVRARQQFTARAWGQSKRSAVASTGASSGAEDPPVERMRQTYVPFSGSEVAVHEFSFTYSFRYSSGLTGLWSSGLTL